MATRSLRGLKGKTRQLEHELDDARGLLERELAAQQITAEGDLAYLAYLAEFQPGTFAKWMHLIREHPTLTRRPCGCPDA